MSSKTLGIMSGLSGLVFWKKAKYTKTSRSVDVSRAITEQRARFNPLRNFTPERLVHAIDCWRIGTLCDLARILEELEQRDDMIIACSQKMKASVARCKHSVQIVEGQENNPQAQLHKKTLEDFWANIRTSSVFCRNERGGFRLLVKQMMDAVHAKYAVHEIIWEPHRDGTISAKFQFVPLWMFENHTGELRYLDYYGAYDGIPMKPGEWMVTVGEGVGIAAAVAAMSKRLSLNDWLLFSEKCGIPGLHAKTGAPEDSDEWEKLVDALRSFGKDWAVVTGQETDVATISLANSGQTPYPELVKAMNKAISVLYRGADLSTQSGEGGDANGASLQGKESDILEQDACEMLSETLQEQVERFVIEYVYGKGVRPLAYIQIEPNAKEDSKLDMEIDNHLMDAGVSLSKNDMLQRYGRTEWKPEDKKDAPVKRQTPSMAPGMQNNSNLFNNHALANENDDESARRAAWASLQADLKDALSACEKALSASDVPGLIEALKKLPKTADGHRLAAQLKERMKAQLANANFEENEHPRDKGGRFIKGESEGRTIETYAYAKEGRHYKLNRKGEHIYGPEAVEDKFSFGKRFDGLPKRKDTPHFDANKSVKDSGKRTFGEMSEKDYYRRDDKPIAYPDGKEPKEGQPKYNWTRGGKKLSSKEAYALEQACAEGISGQLLTPDTTSVKVRCDYYNGKNQIAQFVGGTGKPKTIYDARTESFRQEAKFRQVDSVVENYDKLFGTIASDCTEGNYEANVAYFLTRTKCRIGGGAKNDNLGALDLTSDQIKVDGDTVTLDFDAKNSHWKQTIRDRRLAKWMSKQLKESKPGEPVLGSRTTPNKVNGYLTSVGDKCGVVKNSDGKGFTAHNIRHAGATRLADELVDEIEINPSEDRKGYISALASVVRDCGRHIGDTGKLAFEKYISPKVLFKNAPELLEIDAAWRIANEETPPAESEDFYPQVTNILADSYDDEDDDVPFYTEADYERIPVLKELLAIVEANDEAEANESL